MKQLDSGQLARTGAALLLIALMGWLLYGSALSIGYLSDDFDLLYAATAPAFSMLDAFPAGSSHYFRPLVMLSLRLEHLLVPGDPAFVHHLSNLAIHLLTSILVFLTCYATAPRWGLALGLALLFLVHPANVTDVYWISGRTDSMVALFYLLGLLGFIRFVQTGGAGWLGVSAAGLIGSLLSKEMGVTLVATLGLMFLFLEQWGASAALLSPSRRRQALGAWMIFALLTVGYLACALWRSYRPTEVGALAARLLESPKILAKFFLLLVYPNHESTFVLIHRSNPEFALGGAALALAGIGTAVYCLRHQGTRDRWLAIVLIALVIVSVTPLAFFGGIFSRQMYLPLAMLCIALAAWALAKPRVQRVALCITYLLLLPLTIAAIRDSAVWVRNWNASEAYCRTFQSVMAQAPADPAMLFLTMPEIADDAPIFSYDLNGALFFCRNRRFGYFSRLDWIGRVAAEGAATNREIVSLEPAQGASYQVSLQAPDAYFRFPLDTQVGATFATARYSVQVDSMRGPGRVSRFRVAFSNPQSLSDTHLLWFTGASFERVAQ